MGQQLSNTSVLLKVYNFDSFFDVGLLEPFFILYYWLLCLFSSVKANMNSNKPLQTAAIFFISNFYLKQGIG